MAMLDKPTAGSVWLDGQETSALRESAVAAFRRDNLGFVFQEFNLPDTFSLEDNIYLPLLLAGLHMVFAFPMIQKLLTLFAFYNVKLFVFTTAGSFALFALFYALVYRLTSNVYYRIVSADDGERI